MIEPGRCSSCGPQLDPPGPGGFCPICLPKMGLATAAGTTSADVPSVIGPYHVLQALGVGDC